MGVPDIMHTTEVRIMGKSQAPGRLHRDVLRRQPLEAPFSLDRRMSSRQVVAVRSIREKLQHPFRPQPPRP